VHVPGSEVGEGAAAFVLVLDAHVPGRGRGEGRVAADAGLDGGLLVCGDATLMVTSPDPESDLMTLMMTWSVFRLPPTALELGTSLTPVNDR
jgi:hypothetical protein